MGKTYRVAKRLGACYEPYPLEASDNRKYWYNTVTKKSVWNCPEEIAQLKTELECSWEPFENKTIAISRLKTLFRIRGITTKMKFDEVQNNVKADKRFALFSCLSAGEKKQALAEYQTQLKKQERDRERSQKAEARKLFNEALSKWSDLTIISLLSDFTSAYADEWWVKVLSVSELEELFDDYVEENKKFLYDKQNEKKEKQKDEILEFFRSRPKVHFLTRWDDLVDQHLDAFPKIYEHEPRSVLQWWEYYVLEEMQEYKNHLQQVLNRAQRHKRDAFRNFLNNLIDKGQINARTTFYDFVHKYNTAKEYRELIGIPITTPRRIFEYATEPLVKLYDKEKSIFKTAIKSSKLQVTPSSTYEEFLDFLNEKHPKLIKQLSETNIKLFFESLRRQALKRRKEQNSIERESSRRKQYRTYSSSPYKKRSEKDRKNRYKYDEKSIDDGLKDNVDEDRKEESEEEEGEACEDDRREEGEADVEEGEERDESYRSNRNEAYYKTHGSKEYSKHSESYQVTYEKQHRT